jgi:hypothetical protein
MQALTRICNINVEIVKAVSPAFKGMGVFNRRSITVGYSPLEDDGMSNLGVDFLIAPMWR